MRRFRRQIHRIDHRFDHGIDIFDSVFFDIGEIRVNLCHDTVTFRINNNLVNDRLMVKFLFDRFGRHVFTVGKNDQILYTASDKQLIVRREIADITGISRNGVRLRLEKVKKLLLGYERALGLYKSYLVSSAEADKLENIIKENLTGKKQKEALGILDKIKNGGNIADV